MISRVWFNSSTVKSSFVFVKEVAFAYNALFGGEDWRGCFIIFGWVRK